MTRSRAAFLSGGRDALPTIPANASFGVVAGVAAVNVGYSPVAAVALSASVFGGASQLAALELVRTGAPVAVVVLTALVVNLRYTMYSAAIAPHFRSFSRAKRALASFFLLDVTYAIAIVKYRRDEAVDKAAYFFGVAAVLWGTWVVTTAGGVVLGTSLPPSWHLDFAVPLLFLSLLFPTIEDRGGVVAALVGGVVAVAGAGVPFDLGLLIAAGIGIAAGVVVGPGTDAAGSEGEAA